MSDIIMEDIELCGEPPVWADKRQALCDALPYFKSHQGSLYTNKLVAKGLLIDGEISIRDIMTSDVIITSLGGGRVKGTDGNMTRTREASSTLFTAATAAMKQTLPVGVVAGENYPLFAAPPPHAYNVLGWFTITDMWVEKDDKGIALHKLRLEKTDKSSQSWWIPKDVATSSGEPERSYPPIRLQCGDCEQDSKHIFTQGWVCLSPNCDEHFLLPNGEPISDIEYASDNAASMAWCIECKQPSKCIFAEAWTCLHKGCPVAFEFPGNVNTSELTYSWDFLHERTACVAAGEPIQPALPKFEEAGTTLEFRCGIVCPECHGCSRRRDWDYWVCETDGCDFVLPAAPQPYSLMEVMNEKAEAQKRKTFKMATSDPLVESFTKTIGAYHMEGFLLPEPGNMDNIIGSVHIFRATDHINSGMGGADQLWGEIQNATGLGFALSRNPVRTPGHKTEVLTRHFQQNWGAPYKFVVNVLSKGFSEAPDFILRALMRMDWAGRKSVESASEKIDGMGCDAYMSPASDQHVEDEFLPFNELLSLGYMEGDCISYHDDGEDTLGPTVATLSLGSPASMAFRVKKKGDKRQPEVLKFPIYHGDMVVMHGADIHRHYEHKVDPWGKRRFALTSRHIVLETLDQATRREAERKGAIPQRAAQWAYNGQ